MLTYLNPKSNEYCIVEHHFYDGKTREISKTNILRKTMPLYYNDTMLIGIYKMHHKDKFALFHFKSQTSEWLNWDQVEKILPTLKMVYFQENLDENTVDPALFPHSFIADPNFTSAQYIHDSEGQRISYEGKPLIAVQTKEIKNEYVNQYSKQHWWKKADFLFRKCFVGLYNPTSQTFDWVYEEHLNQSNYYKMNLYQGVFPLDKQRILVVNNYQTAILNLESGVIKHQSTIE